jgi:sensor domain CHASE-containing protein
MPFGLGAGESIIILLGLVVWLLPLGAAVWAFVTLSRLRTSQQELLAKMTLLERRLSERP